MKGSVQIAPMKVIVVSNPPNFANQKYIELCRFKRYEQERERDITMKLKLSR